MADIDPAAVMAAHEGHTPGAYGVCKKRFGYEWSPEPPCEPYRLAAALAAALVERDEARKRAVMLRGIVEKVDEALGVLPYDDCLIHYGESR